MPINDLQLVFILVLVFQLKHFLADFPLQIPYMLRKSEKGWGFFAPLLAHTAVHGLFTLLIILCVDASYWWLFMFDMGIHFMMDRIKSSPRYLGRFNDPKTALFWNIFGFDQLVHKLTDIFIVYCVVMKI